jgi:hypothetical protein
MSGAQRVLLLPLLLACSSSAPPAPPPAPVKVQGASQDLRRLAGTWLGEFRSDQDDRHGTISFSLAVDSDTAFGHVTLKAPPRAPECVDPARPLAPSRVVAPIVLRVGALATSEGSVGGWMRPYLDPEAGCWVDTWFEGRLMRDTLRGTYFSRRTGTGPIRQGSWWAARQRVRGTFMVPSRVGR